MAVNKQLNDIVQSSSVYTQDRGYKPEVEDETAEEYRSDNRHWMDLKIMKCVHILNKFILHMPMFSPQ